MKKIKIYTLLPFVILISMTCAACGTESDTDEMEQENDEFPISRPDGGEVITEDWNGNTGQVTLRYDNSRYEIVVEYYDNYTSGGGWNRNEIGQGEVPTINYMNLTAGLNISIDPPNDQISGVFIVTLTVS
jgi:hypothetical protein